MGLKIVITAGGTRERVDDVRYITNMSTGKLAHCILERLLYNMSIDLIYYICPNTAYLDNDLVKTFKDKLEIVYVRGALDVKQTVSNILTSETIDWFIHSMAISDYTVDYVSSANRISKCITTTLSEMNIPDDEIYDKTAAIINGECSAIKIDNDTKISSAESDIVIKLKKTPKIISCIKELSPNTKLIGFKLLSNVSQEHLIQVATKLLIKNKCDYVVANDLAKIKRGSHTATIINSSGKKQYCYGKEDIADSIVALISQ